MAQDAQTRIRTEDASVGELVTRLSEQTARLVRDEMKLAQREMQATAKHAGLGAGMFSGAGLIALYGLAAAITGAIAALALVLPVWGSALVVAGALFLVAGIAALVGKKQFDQVSAKPERTVRSVQRDVEELKERRSS